MIAFSPVSQFQVLLPAGNGNTSILNLFIQLRDTFDCTTEINLTSVIVLQDSIDVTDLVNNLQNSTSNSVVQLLSSGNQNIVAQVITSFSQQFNQINTNNTQTAVASKYLPFIQ
jgi:hypothetical protein